MLTLLDCRLQNRILVIATSTVSMCQNRPISFVFLGWRFNNPGVHFNNPRWVLIRNSGNSVGQWEALLVEANPQFTPALTAVATQYPGSSPFCLSQDVRNPYGHAHFDVATSDGPWRIHTFSYIYIYTSMYICILLCIHIWHYMYNCVYRELCETFV
jgi:hypothetical protein